MRMTYRANRSAGKRIVDLGGCCRLEPACHRLPGFLPGHDPVLLGCHVGQECPAP